MADAPDWSVAKVELTSGKVLVVNFRAIEPPGVERSAFRTRVMVRLPYPDRGDGLPSSEHLARLQGRELELESPTSLRLISKTGEGRREALFQVADQDNFLRLLGDSTFE